MAAISPLFLLAVSLGRLRPGNADPRLLGRVIPPFFFLLEQNVDGGPRKAGRITVLTYYCNMVTAPAEALARQGTREMPVYRR